jgi:putative ATPase
VDLFEYQGNKTTSDTRPLADRMRPRSLDDFIGQPHISGHDALIRKAIVNDRIFSMILWGPPGCGKTSLANIIAHETRSDFVQISAVLSGVKDIRDVIEQAKKQLNLHQKRTILFVDEIHRFNKSQQDAFLHHVESGLITLIGASTENPSFEVIPALLSRCRVITLNAHHEKDIVHVLIRALEDKEQGLGRLGLTFEDDALLYIADLSDGDIRSALNNLETLAYHALKNDVGEGESRIITLTDLEDLLQKKALLYDKTGEEHYNLISAFHKSLRGSDPDAAMYWLARMLLAGEDPLYVARRMVRFASEDVGLADNNALTVAMNAMEAYRFLGYPEGELALVQSAVYLATAPKSNSIYTAYDTVRDTVTKTGALPAPMHIRNAPTRLMKDLGYGDGYKYAHNYKGAYIPQDYLPEKLQGHVFYNPSDRGYEKTVRQRLDAWLSLKRELNHGKENTNPDKDST